MGNDSKAAWLASAYVHTQCAIDDVNAAIALLNDESKMLQVEALKSPEAYVQHTALIYDRTILHHAALMLTDARDLLKGIKLYYDQCEGEEG